MCIETSGFMSGDRLYINAPVAFGCLHIHRNIKYSRRRCVRKKTRRRWQQTCVALMPIVSLWRSRWCTCFSFGWSYYHRLLLIPRRIWMAPNLGIICRCWGLLQLEFVRLSVWFVLWVYSGSWAGIFAAQETRGFSWKGLKLEDEGAERSGESRFLFWISSSGWSWLAHDDSLDDDCNLPSK